MATVQLYGPYYVLTTAENRFMPGEVRVFGFGPWPAFADGTATISANIQDFSSFGSGGTSRAITVESIEYSFDTHAQRYIWFVYRNSASEPMQGWYFNLSVVLP